MVAIGEVDEANSALGLAVLAVAAIRRLPLPPNWRASRTTCSILAPIWPRPRAARRRFRARRHDLADRAGSGRLARTGDRRAQRRSSPLTSFILPGGSEAAARVHLARAIVRRAERAGVALAAAEPVNPAALAYLNRLSDYCFVLARAQQGRRSALGSGRQPLLIGRLDQPGLIFGLRPACPRPVAKERVKAWKLLPLSVPGRWARALRKSWRRRGWRSCSPMSIWMRPPRGASGSARGWRVLSPRKR
jgi:cob(I)alamin adenosyltransferase